MKLAPQQLSLGTESGSDAYRSACSEGKETQRCWIVWVRRFPPHLHLYLLLGHPKMILFKEPETLLALVVFSNSSQAQSQVYHCHSYLASPSLSFFTHTMGSGLTVGIK